MQYPMLPKPKSKAIQVSLGSQFQIHNLLLGLRTQRNLGFVLQELVRYGMGFVLVKLEPFIKMASTHSLYAQVSRNFLQLAC